VRGRDREWRAVLDLLRGVEDGRAGALLVDGEPGVGKTRLLAEAAEHARARGFTVAAGAAEELGELAPLAPLAAALGVRTGGDEPEPTLAERLRAELDARAAAGPVLVALDDLHFADPGTLRAVRTLQARLRNRRIAWLLARSPQYGGAAGRLFDLLERGGARRLGLAPLPAEVIAEVAADAAGAPPGRDLLELIEGAGGNPRLVVDLLAGLRDEDALDLTGGDAHPRSARPPARLHGFARERLTRLGREARHLLALTAVLGRPFALEEVGELLGATPAALLPALEEALAAGLLAADGDAIGFRQELVRQAILAVMPGPVRHALHRQIGEYLIESGGPPAEAAEHLTLGVRHGDRHALACLDTAVARILPVAPPAAAGLAVRALDLTGPADPRRPARALAAVEATTEAGLLDQATALAETALAQPFPPDARAALHAAYSHVLYLRGRPDDALRHAEAALRDPTPEPVPDTTGDAALGSLPGDLRDPAWASLPDDLRAPALDSPSEGLRDPAWGSLPGDLRAPALDSPPDDLRDPAWGSPPDGLRDPASAVLPGGSQARRPAALSDDLRDRATRALLDAAAARGDHSLVRKHAEAVLAAEHQHDEALAVTALGTLAVAEWDRGRLGDGLALARAAARHAGAARRVHPGLTLAEMLADIGHHDEAQTVLQQTRQEIETLAHVPWRAAATTLQARLDLAAGRLDQAAEAATAVLGADTPTPALFAPAALAVLRAVELRRGDPRPASAHQLPPPPSDGPPDPVAHPATHATQRLLLLTARLAEVRDGPERALALVADLVAEPHENPWPLFGEPGAAAWLVRTALAVGDRARAEQLVAVTEQLVRDNPTIPAVRYAAAHARGLLDADPEALGQAEDAAPDPWARASAAEDLGVTSADSGDRRSATAALLRALAAYQQAGAERDVARVRRRLRRLGVRRRHWSYTERPVTGWDSLTDTERTISLLVAEGHTNRQIADQLFVSVHTVAFHLRQVFRKLGIRSRVQLTRLALDREQQH